MSQSKLGKHATDIFAATTAQPVDAAEEKTLDTKVIRGRPQVHSERWTKVTTVLFDRQIAWLDHLGADIRTKTGKALSRAEIIRGILSAIEQSSLNLSNAGSEKDLTNQILTSLAENKSTPF